jgi:hypothetical protein
MYNTNIPIEEMPAERNTTAAVASDFDGRTLFWEKFVCVSAVVGVLAVAVTLFRYAHPLADDFARGYKGRAQGIVPSIVNEYFTWTGRWAACGLSYFLTTSFDIVRFYPLLLTIIPLALAAAVYLQLQASEIGATRRQRAALTAALLAVYWAGLPDPGDNFYWLTGSVDNVAGLVLSLLLLAGLIGFRARTPLLSVAAGIGLSLLAVLATGFHEVFGLLLCVVLAGGTFRAWLARDPRRWSWTVCLAAALIGFLIVYIAPGNGARRAEFPLAANLGVTLQLTIKQGVSNVIPWILDIRLLAATILMLILAPHSLIERGRSSRVTTRDIIIVLLTWATAIFAAFAAVSWAIGMKMAPRTLDGIYFIFLAGWFWVLVMVMRRFAERDEPLLIAAPLLRRIAVAIFVVAMLLTGNTWKALQDLRGAAPVYSAAMNARYRSLAAAAARGERDVAVEPLPQKPESFIKYFELREDPDYWENWSVAHYFGLNTVRMSGKSDENR